MSKNRKIVVLGSTGYVGGKFLNLFEEKGIDCVGLSRRDVNYEDRDTLISFLKDARPTFLINAAGFTGKPNVDACEIYKSDTLMGNAVLPGIVRSACEAINLPWGHVSSGCIFTGRNDKGDGFNESDPANFSFRTDNCSFYSGTKALGEEVLSGAECFIWRLRIPFNNEAIPRNYLYKLLNYNSLLEAENSISHLEEFVSACWECWSRRLPFGVYNVTNPGTVTTREVVKLMQEESRRRKELGLEDPFGKEYTFFEDEDDFMAKAAKTPRSNCVLDTTKLEQAGIKLTPVREAIQKSLQEWTTI